MTTAAVDPSPRAWLRRYGARPAALVRLICLPPGGAGASFYWPIAARLPREIELVSVQYPGRQDRIGEPCVDDMAAMVGHLSRLLPPLADRPLALFGHSLGGAVAFELAHRLEQKHDLRMRCTIISGRPPPDRPRPGTRHLDDDELWADLRRLEGAAPELLESALVRQKAIPALRADYHLVETYTPRLLGPISGSLEAWYGAEDPEISASEAEIWRRFTTAKFRARVFVGGHFYLRHKPDDVADVLADRLVLRPATNPHEEGAIGWGNR
jgi:pyochelin biosynthesis protein PchC